MGLQIWTQHRCAAASHLTGSSPPSLACAVTPRQLNCCSPPLQTPVTTPWSLSHPPPSCCWPLQRPLAEASGRAPLASPHTFRQTRTPLVHACRRPRVSQSCTQIDVGTRRIRYSSMQAPALLHLYSPKMPYAPNIRAAPTSSCLAHPHSKHPAHIKDSSPSPQCLSASKASALASELLS
jgi:hypothetical protein